jgi:hypothetical protein
MFNAGFKDVKCAGNIYFESCSGKILAVKQPHGSQMKDVIHAFHSFVQNINFPDIAAIGKNLKAGIMHYRFKIVPFAAGEIIIHYDLGHRFLQEFLNDKTADEAGTSDDQNPTAVQGERDWRVRNHK